MVQTLAKLSALKVQSLTEPGMHNDGGGLWLNVKASGSKSWIFRYRLHGKRRDLGLGSLESVSLKDARELARLARLKVAQGVDPIQDKREQTQAARGEVMTFAQAVDMFLESQSSAWSNDKHKAQWRTTLTDYAIAKFGKVPVSKVDTRHVLSAIEPLWHDRTETATRLRGRIERVLDYARVKGYRTGENPARWRGHLSFILPPPAQIRERKHLAAMPYAQVPVFMSWLRGVEGYTARALELAILTAARSGEVRKATWDEIDLKRAIWTVPAARMKAGVQHQVPLSTQAVELLQALPIEGDLLFHGAKPNKPLSDMTLTQMMRRANYTETVHGFRSSFRDWVAEQTTYPRDAAEHALAHRLPDQVEAAYLRSTFLDQRRQMMQDWANFVGGGIENDKK